MSEEKNILYVQTSHDPERQYSPLVLAQSARAMDIKAIVLALNEMALGCGNIKVANIIALGVLHTLKPKLLMRKTIISVLEETFSIKGSLEVNLKAFKLGERFNQ